MVGKRMKISQYTVMDFFRKVILNMFENTQGSTMFRLDVLYLFLDFM